MSARVFRSLLRTRAFLYAFMLIAVMLTPAVSGFTHAAQEGSLAFFFCALVLPLALGIILSATLHEPMHRPFSIVLPGARRRFMRSHARALALLGVAFALLAWLKNHALPLPVVWSVSVAVMALSLPLEPRVRLVGIRWFALVPIAAALAAVRWPTHLQEFALEHPTVTSLGALAWTAASFGVAYSRARWRARAQLPCTSFLTAFDSPEHRIQLGKEALARAKASSARWQPPASWDGTAAWMRASTYERFGQQRLGWIGTSLLMCGALVVLGLATAADSPTKFTEQPTLMMPLFVVLLMTAHRGTGPSPARLYPLSRARRASVTFTASLLQLTTNLTFVVVATALTLWAATDYFQIQLTSPAIQLWLLAPALAVPLDPVCRWIKLQAEVQGIPDQSTALFVGMGTGVIGSQVLRSWPEFFVSTGTLTTFGVIILASQIAYYFSLQRFYRQNDLIQRRVRRGLFGLG